MTFFSQFYVNYQLIGRKYQKNSMVKSGVPYDYFYIFALLLTKTIIICTKSSRRLT